MQKGNIFIIVLFVCLLIVGGVVLVPKIIGVTESTALTSLYEQQSRYLDYNETIFSQLKSKKRVIFFYQTLCPACIVFDENLKKNQDRIPTEIVIFKAIFDKEQALREKYKVSSPNTFVYVNGNGQTINNWNGGDLNTLLANTTE